MDFLSNILPFLYLGTTVVYIALFIQKKYIFEKLSQIFLIILVLSHITSFFLYIVEVGHMPVSNIFEALSSIALAVILIYFLIELLSQVRTTGFIFIGIAFILHTIYEIFSESRGDVDNLFTGKADTGHNPLFIWHTGFAIASYAAFIIAAIYGVLYLFLFRNLKTKNFGMFFKRMPSLEELDEMNFKGCVIGLLLLIPAVSFGYIWKVGLYGHSLHFDPKVIISLLLCFLYGFQITAHLKLQWSGRRKSYLSILGFLAIIFSMVVGNMITEFHQFF